MKLKYSLLSLALVSMSNCVNTVSAFEPWYVNSYPGVAVGVNGGYGNYGYGYGPYGFGLGLGLGAGYGYQAQTPESADTTAMGNLVRAQGQYNESTAKAAVDQEEARRRYIDNQQKFISNRLEVKRNVQALNMQQHEASVAARMHQEDFQAAHRPMPLPADQVNPTTGAIVWPEYLRADQFAMARKSMDTLFEERARYGMDADRTAKIKLNAAELKEVLRSHIQDIPLAQYSEARKFLDRLVATAN